MVTVLATCVILPLPLDRLTFWFLRATATTKEEKEGEEEEGKGEEQGRKEGNKEVWEVTQNKVKGDKKEVNTHDFIFLPEADP